MNKIIEIIGIQNRLKELREDWKVAPPHKKRFLEITGKMLKARLEMLKESQ